MKGAKRYQSVPAVPCDSCEHRRFCGAAGVVCAAFQRFIERDPWTPEMRRPSLKVTRLAREQHVREVAQETLEERKARKRAYHRAWRAANRERLREQGRRYYQRHRQAILERTRKPRREWMREHPETRVRNNFWRQANREHLRESARRRWWTNHAANCATRRAYYATNRERILAGQREYRKRQRESARAAAAARAPVVITKTNERAGVAAFSPDP